MSYPPRPGFPPHPQPVGPPGSQSPLFRPGQPDIGRVQPIPPRPGHPQSPHMLPRPVLQQPSPHGTPNMAHGTPSLPQSFPLRPSPQQPGIRPSQPATPPPSFHQPSGRISQGPAGAPLNARPPVPHQPAELPHPHQPLPPSSMAGFRPPVRPGLPPDQAALGSMDGIANQMSGMNVGATSPSMGRPKRVYPSQQEPQLSAAPPPFMNGHASSLPPGNQIPPGQPSAGFQPPPFAAQASAPQFATQASAPQFGAPSGPPSFQQARPSPPFDAGPLQGTPRTSVGDGNRSRIDPNQIPSPVAVQESDQQNHLVTPWGTMTKSLPPLASSYFRSVDEGSASPRFVRMTTYQIPLTEELLNLSALPMAMIVQPYADLLPCEMPVPVVPPSELGPIRCDRCKGYINPFCNFIDGGRKFVCSLCQFDNVVPNEYFCNLDMTGRRLDLQQRPELLFGSVDWIATKDYFSRPARPASFLIALDVSWNSLQSGMIIKACEAIKELLYGTPTDETPDAGKGLPPGCKIGIMTFDRSVHFYNLKDTLDVAQMMIVPDVNDMFVPLHEGLLVDPHKSRDVIEGLLNALPRLFEGSVVTETVLGSALEACYSAMVCLVSGHVYKKKGVGGKLLIFQMALPTIGPGALKNREDIKLLGTDKEKVLYEPQEYFWKKTGENLAVAGVSVDLFLFPTAYIDIASLGSISSLTGGSIYNYPGFDPVKQGTRLKNDIHRALSRKFAFEALLRVRTSNGLKVVEHFGNFYMSNTTDIELAGVDNSTAFAVSLRHDGKLDERLDSVLQVAMLYTTVTGERRIRIHTVSLTNTSLLANVFRCAEMDSTMNYLAKAAVAQANSSSLKQVREQLTDKCVRILTSYRKNVASSTSPGQLILPESFKLYPIYSLGLLKNKAFRSGSDISSDARVFSMKLLNSLSVSDSIPLIYPRMIPLHNLPPEAGEIHPETGRIQLPPAVRASFERLDASGIYAIENGSTMMIWVGRQVSPGLVKDVFGVESVEQIDLRMHVLPEIPSDYSRRIRSMMKQIQSDRSRYPLLQIVRHQLDPFLEAEFSNMLLEDKNLDAMSYVDYLCFVHRNIQIEMNSS